MLSAEYVRDAVKQAKAEAPRRSFKQSVELVLGLRDIDVKKQEVNINEVVYLPHKFSQEARVCVFASGDLAVRARKAGVDRVIEPEELDRISTSKRELRKIASGHTFFLAEPTLMPRIGKLFGQYLGPRGKMPSPVAAATALEGMVERLRSAIRVRARGQMSITCKVGEEDMPDEKIAENAVSVIAAIERKLPSGSKNIARALVKLSMGQVRAISVPEGK